MDLNFLERGIARLSPAWGCRRLEAKAALEQARIVARAYDAARRDRRTEGWRATGGSANAELAPALRTILNRSRDLCRNNEWAINGKLKWKTHLIGPGIVPRPVATGKAKDTARDAWEQFSDNCDPEGRADFYGKQAQLIGEVYEGGAAFLRWYPRPSEMGLKVPLQCDVLEHDYLDTQKTEILRSGNVVIHGVEYDGYGRRVAYWLFPHHPGEATLFRRASFRSERVPAEWCDHVFRTDRPGQVTGVPWLAASMLRYRDAADWEEAEQVRKKISACFTVFVRRGNMQTAGLGQAVEQSKGDPVGGRRLEKIAPGVIAYIDGDGEITPAVPPATPDDGHMERQQYAFAAGLGLPFATLTGNLRNVNFTSMREGKLDFHAVLDQYQWHMCVPQISRPSWRRVMRMAAGRGLQVSPETPAKYAMPKRPWVKPDDDLRAAAMELALGLESWPELAASRGYDPDDLLEEIKHWLPRLKGAGLDPAAVPGIAKLGVSGATNPDKSGKPEDVVTEDDDVEEV